MEHLLPASILGTQSVWLSQQFILPLVVCSLCCYWLSEELHLLTDTSPEKEESWKFLNRRMDDISDFNMLTHGVCFNTAAACSFVQLYMNSSAIIGVAVTVLQNAATHSPAIFASILSSIPSIIFNLYASVAASGNSPCYSQPKPFSRGASSVDDQQRHSSHGAQDIRSSNSHILSTSSAHLGATPPNPSTTNHVTSTTAQETPAAPSAVSPSVPQPTTQTNSSSSVSASVEASDSKNCPQT